ncbi:MAG TPA: hypothetical protein VER03_08840 [Bryobacteraceae bacterium]|nr:hypothetical protein [Bryobacteraceae bacterium]
MKAGNFSDRIFRTIYDPASLQTSNGQQVRQPFPGNCIPLSAMSL